MYANKNGKLHRQNGITYVQSLVQTRTIKDRIEILNRGSETDITYKDDSFQQGPSNLYETKRH